MLGDVIVLLIIVLLAGGGGIVLGMLLAPRLARLAERAADDGSPPEEAGDPDRP